MSDKVIDFQARKESQLHQRKEAKLDAMRQAFRLARSEADKADKADKAESRRKKRRKSKK